MHTRRILLALAVLAVLFITATVLVLPRPGPTGAVFPGCNGRIAFESGRDGNSEIYVMDPNGSGQTRLTDNPADDSDPAWSADGARIAFSSDRDGNHEIYVMNADGSGQTRLTDNPADDRNPAWSPDGSRIAFSSDRDGNGEIYVMNADGSGETKLASGLDPAWSPDGSQIAFSRGYSEDAGIYVVNADGSGQARLTDWIFDDSPAWSPDGFQIVFVRLSPIMSTGTVSVLLINADGSGETKLASGLDPAWSPDGTQIALTSGYGSSDIAVINADGSGWTRLTDSPAGDGVPDWQSLPVAGDVDCDRFLSSIDALVILQCVAGVMSSPTCQQGADVNRDGAVSAVDAALVLQHVAGLFDLLPCGPPLPTPTPCGPEGCPTATATPTPIPPDFSIGIDTDGDTADNCGTRAAETTKCSASLGDTLPVSVYLNGHGLPDYVGFDIVIEYDGVTSKDNPTAAPWPDCVFEASFFEPGFVAWGCIPGIDAPPSTYLGLIGTNDFNCDTSGTIAMLGSQQGETALVDSSLHTYREGTDETLTINCIESNASLTQSPAP